jgi:Biotin carboxylase C-terminal domain
VQEHIVPRGVAIQCRVTTENPERDFAPDTGTVTLYRHSAGKGVRMDGIGYSGLKVTPYFDSMLVKYTVLGATFDESVRRMMRVLQECRIRGVKTNFVKVRDIFFVAMRCAVRMHIFFGLTVFHVHLNTNVRFIVCSSLFFSLQHTFASRISKGHCYD